MPDSASNQKNRLPNSELRSSDGETLFRFGKADLEDLHDLLGDKVKGALPSLNLAAAVYQAARDYKSTLRSARKQLARLGAVLQQVEEIDAALSPEANLVLERACFDRNAPITAFGETTARQALSAAVHACAQVRARIDTSHKGSRHNGAAWFLAHGVGRALAAVGEPLSKGRDGTFGRVLAVMWHAVEPKGSPEEIFPYLKVVADVARLRDPELPKAPKGRRRGGTK